MSPRVPQFANYNGAACHTFSFAACVANCVVSIVRPRRVLKTSCVFRRRSVIGVFRKRHTKVARYAREAYLSPDFRRKKKKTVCSLNFRERRFCSRETLLRGNSLQRNTQSWGEARDIDRENWQSANVPAMRCEGSPPGGKPP